MALLSYYNLSENTDWTYGSWSAQNRRVHFPFDKQMRVLGEWHYRHCVIMAWGSLSLKIRMYPSCFHSAEERWSVLLIYFVASRNHLQLRHSPLQPQIIFRCHRV